MRYNNLEVFVLTKQLYEKLEIDWKKNKWDIQELTWICYEIEQNYSMLDPTNFLNDECTYVNHPKIVFILNSLIKMLFTNFVNSILAINVKKFLILELGNV